MFFKVFLFLTEVGKSGTYRNQLDFLLMKLDLIMPSPSLKSLEEISSKKIQQQIDYFTSCKMPGLLSGFSSKEERNDDNKKECWNSSVKWFSGGSEHSTGREGGCEVGFRLCYAGRVLGVRLFFTPRQPWMPPDLYIDDKQFMDAITLEMVQEQLSSLVHWPECRTNCVAELAEQIYKLYKKYQLSRLHNQTAESNKLLEECKAICESLDITEDDTEVLLCAGEQVLCVKLPINFDLPPPLFTEDAGEASCVLHIAANSSKAGSLVATLRVSPKADSLLCGPDGEDRICLPPIPEQRNNEKSGEFLVSYTEDIVQIINARIKQVHQSFETRKQIVAQLLCQYDASISQYDAVRFNTVELLLLTEEEDFHYLVDIVFPRCFPQVCARVMLRSICQKEGEKQEAALVPPFNHKPKGEPDEMLEAILRSATDFAPVFRRQCNNRRILAL
uniref:BRISC and BRCA1-A complex member 2 n=1 Tax=Hirondellea gigas TaxID=1518452 RepID=A0A2P2HYK4_9CRUS